MSRTIRCYNKWAKLHNQRLRHWEICPISCSGEHKYYCTAEWWKQWPYGKGGCYQCKDALVMVHVHNKRKRILLKKHKFEMI